MQDTRLLHLSALSLMLLLTCRVGHAQEPNVCEGVTCSNHGTCVAKGGDPVCACHEGYVPDATTGLSCQPSTATLDPTTAAVAPVPATETIAVHFEPKKSKDVYKVQVSDSDDQVHECTTPCTMSIAPGKAHIKVIEGGKNKVWWTFEKSAYRVTIRHRKMGLFIAGAVLMMGGVAGLISSVIYIAVTDNRGVHTLAWNIPLCAAIIAGLGMGFGAGKNFMFFEKDDSIGNPGVKPTIGKLHFQFAGLAPVNNGVMLSSTFTF